MSKHLQVLPQVQSGIAGSGEGASSISQAIPSEIPQPPVRLVGRERKVWEYITKALFEYGLIHRTDAMVMTVICRTFIRWVDSEEELSKVIKENGGYMVATPNGYEQPHQLFYVARSLKKELLQWLPEAALTIPSFVKAIEDRPAPVQGTLFEDPVAAHQKRKTALGIRSV